jgi:hypothetical protein
MPYGVAQSNWNEAKAEARRLMIARARVRGMIPYSELARATTSAHFEPHDQQFFHLIGEISAEEDAAGRGMLSVVVVHRHGDRQPGPGFFEFARQLGRDTSDILRCWVDELHRVHAVWSTRNPE